MKYRIRQGKLQELQVNWIVEYNSSIFNLKFLNFFEMCSDKYIYNIVNIVSNPHGDEPVQTISKWSRSEMSRVQITHFGTTKHDGRGNQMDQNVGLYRTGIWLKAVLANVCPLHGPSSSEERVVLQSHFCRQGIQS